MITQALLAVADERMLDCNAERRKQAAAMRHALDAVYERFLWAVVERSKEGGGRAMLELADRCISQRRYEDGAARFAMLASAHRERRDYLARAHWLRGIVLLESGAYVEARLELRRALDLDPDLHDAALALESMATTRLRPLRATR